MKKEAINTFGEGMIMDLHPLATPNNVLVKCLNGTIITYNGNEFVLQNDQGNGEVHTAYLDKGYVPVGMKEHGGIIYVAAYNPITKKSQIGSFPSPQQLYEGDDLNVTPIEIRFSDFITIQNSIPHIKLEYQKQKLFQVNNSDEVKIFHPGDKFIIVSSTIDPDIKEAITNGFIKLRLGVVNSSGGIDFIDDKNLKIYSNGLWIYEGSTEALKDDSYVQVFSARSSGALLLIVELKSFDTFNLIRKYSCDSDNTISVKFIGETTGQYSGNTIDNSNIVGLLEKNKSTVESQIIKSGKSGTQEYTIIPVCPYGALERMAKNGIINFDTIRTNSESLSEWRFYVTDTYLKVGWGYDYYNINDNSDIEKIIFRFVDINNSNEAQEVLKVDGNFSTYYTYEISKEYYNGSFEEIIPFNDNTIRKNWIYIVRIERVVNGETSIIGFKLIYTGGYFNQFYEEYQDFNKQLPSGSSRSKINIALKNSISTSVVPESINLEIKVNDSNSWVKKDTVRPSDYLKELPSSDISIDYRYNTRKIGKYKVSLSPSFDFEYEQNLFSGNPDESIIRNILGESPHAEFGTPDNSGIQFSNTSPLTSEIGQTGLVSNSTLGQSNELTYKDGKFEGALYTSRNIISTNGPIKSITTDIEKLMPIYESNMDVTDRQKLFSFREVGDTLYCAVGNEDTCFYNARILRSNAHTEGSYRGEDGGAGATNDGLRICLTNMGDAIVGIFGGCDCDSASLRYEGTSYNDAACWYKHDQEVDNEDNFLLVTWKDTQGIPYVINLASQKTTTGDTNTRGIIRVDSMIKCILSQLLVAKRGIKNINYVGPNDSESVYHTDFDTSCKVSVQVNEGGTEKDVNFYLQGDKSIEEHMNIWSSVIPDFNNYLPIFKVNLPDQLESIIYYGSNLEFATDPTIINCYTSAYSYYTLTTSTLTNEQRNKIYVGVRVGTNSDGSLILDTNSDGTYKTKSGDNELSDWTGATISLGYNINDRFINSYANSRMSGEIPEGFFNGIYITNTETKRGRWVKGKDGDAPYMAYKIGFGNKSIFNY